LHGGAADERAEDDAKTVIAPKIPSAFALCSGGNAALRRASASGIITAAPAPWTARATISQAMLWASAAAADPATNNPPSGR
jgi:hypothetical protein